MVVPSQMHKHKWLLVMGCLAGSSSSMADADADLAIDDECTSESCALSALQLRATSGSSVDKPTSSEGEMQESQAYHRRPRHVYKPAFGKVASTDVSNPYGYHRRRLVTYWATPLDHGPQQPQFCGINTTRLRSGYEGCCAGQSHPFSNVGCCGYLLYRTDQLSCCKHSNGTATVYDRLTTNCCEDPRVVNKGGGLCNLEPGEPACCHMLSGSRRRSRRRTTRRRRHPLVGPDTKM